MMGCILLKFSRYFWRQCSKLKPSCFGQSAKLKFCFDAISQQCIVFNLHIGYAAALSRNSTYEVFAHTAAKRGRVEMKISVSIWLEADFDVIQAVKFRHHCPQLLALLVGFLRQRCVGHRKSVDVLHQLPPARIIQPNTVAIHTLHGHTILTPSSYVPHHCTLRSRIHLKAAEEQHPTK